jgi:hypothetical protein
MTEQELAARRERLKTAVGDLTLWVYVPNRGRHRMTKTEYVEPIITTLTTLNGKHR